MNATGWLKGLRVTAGGTAIVSHAGVALIRALADNIGLTGGLSQALASDRLLVHDRGRVVADLACAIADGAEVISDFRVMGDQEDLFGLVASVPTAWRTLAEVAGGGQRALEGISAAVNSARRRARGAAAARHSGFPGIRIASHPRGKTTSQVVPSSWQLTPSMDRLTGRDGVRRRYADAPHPEPVRQARRLGPLVAGATQR